MKVGVTGAAGYLGGILLGLLDRDPEVKEIAGIDLVPPRGEHPKLRFTRADVRDPGLDVHLRGCDALVHLAFVVGRAPGHIRLQNSRAVYDINIEGSANVFEAAARAGVRHIVHASSIAAYGCWPDHPPVLTEGTPLRPNPGFYYSETKVRVEERLAEFRRRHPEVKVTILRPSLFIGPTINNPFARMLTARRIPVFRGYDPLYHFTWDEDVARAFHLALKRSPGEVYNIAADPPILASRLGEIVGKPVVRLPFGLAAGLSWLGWTLRLSEIAPKWLDYSRYSTVISSEKARRELGWEPRYTCEEALRKFSEMEKKAERS